MKVKWPFVQSHKLFWILTSSFLIFCIYRVIVFEKGALIWFFSDHRTEIGDAFFYWLTKCGEEWVYFAALGLFLFMSYAKALCVAVNGLIVMLVSYLLKLLFQQPRPAAFFESQGVLEDLNLVDQVHLHLGNTSFPSGHTMSAFAFYALLAFLYPGRSGWGGFMASMAIGVGISRVYLVQHFTQDILFGSVVGVLIAMGVYRFIYLPLSKKPKWKKSLRG